jgi:hypothetical protein
MLGLAFGAFSFYFHVQNLLRDFLSFLKSVHNIYILYLVAYCGVFAQSKNCGGRETTVAG